MPRYRIIGADYKEYGPVTAEQIRIWIDEGRVDSETKLLAEGASQWKRLAELPEFAGVSLSTTPATCPACGEKIQAGFDACWKCGTGRDGSQPSQRAPTENDSPRQERCFRCGSPNIKPGRIVEGGKATAAIFRPEGTRFFSFSLYGGVFLDSEGGCACLECGLVWGHVPPDALKQFILDHGRTPRQEVCDALMSEAARLENEGDVSSAIAKYDTVVRYFEETPEARQAEERILRLNTKPE